MSTQAVYLPPTAPDAEAEVASGPPELSSEQRSKLDILIEHLNSDALALPLTVKECRAAQKARAKQNKDPKTWAGSELNHGGVKSTQKLSDKEKCFLTSEQLQRFLRAVKWDLASAFNRTEETVVWRREFQVELLNEDPSIVEEEARTGKEVVMGWDFQMRPCFYMFPWRQNTKTSERQIQFVVWFLERAVDLMPADVEKLCLLIDFGSGTHGGGQPTSLGQAKKVLDILQNYYCERLGRAVCINVPTIFWGFYRLVGPFVDPVTKDKIRFNPDVRTLVPPSQLEKDNFKGDLDFKYKHEDYYPVLHKMCQEKREYMFKRWQELANGKAGFSEAALRQGIYASTETTHQAKTFASASMSANTSAASGAMTPSSIRTAGYQLPPEASEAPDWVEPSPSTQSQSSMASEEPRTPSKIGNSNSHSLVPDGEVNGRARANSSDSFVTTREVPLHSPDAPVRDDDKLDQALQARNASTRDIQSGIDGLVIHADGSVGAQQPSSAQA